MNTQELTDLYACHLTQDLMASNFTNLKNPKEVEEFHEIIRINMRHYGRAIAAKRSNDNE